MARTQSAESQSEGKLIAGWFKQCGLDITFSVIEDGALSDALYNYDKSGAYAPDYDIYLWSYAGYADPGDTLASFTTSQIEWWNDPCWSNAEYDSLVKEQFSQMDKATRLDTIHRLQQIFYDREPADRDDLSRFPRDRQHVRDGRAGCRIWAASPSSTPSTWTPT